MPQTGDIAPEFELPALIAGVKRRFRLSERRGHMNVVLAFYPSNWATISAEQMVSLQVERERFQASGTETVAICVDSIMNTTAWEREIGPFDFPMCSDFWPHGAVSRLYDVLGSDGTARRAIFIVGKNGRIEFDRILPADNMPLASEILGMLTTLKLAV